MHLTNKILRSTLATVTLSCLAASATAHHGFGLFQLEIKKEWSGTLVKMNLVNPHSYMEIDAIDENGLALHMGPYSGVRAGLPICSWLVLMWRSKVIHTETIPKPATSKISKLMIPR